MSAYMLALQAHVHRVRPVVAEDGTVVVTTPELLGAGSVTLFVFF